MKHSEDSNQKRKLQAQTVRGSVVGIQLGIMANIGQISSQLVQIFLVGLTIGMTRIVVPGLAELEFGLTGSLTISYLLPDAFNV